MLEIILGILLGVLIYYKILKPPQFWANKGITYEPSALPIVGNMKDLALRKKPFFQVIIDLYKKYPSDRYVGYLQFSSPAIMIKDLELIKQISIKNFESFHDHNDFIHEDMDPILSKGLIILKGEKWKQLRVTLSPVFTSSKLRNMYELMFECCQNFVKHFQGRESVDIEMKGLLSRFANDVIATTAFGIKVDAINDPNHEFFLNGQKLTTLSALHLLKLMLVQRSPKLAKLLNVRVLEKDLATFFTNIIVDNMNKRVRTGIIRPDLIQLLLEARKGTLQYDNREETHDSFATVKESQLDKNAKQMELTNEHIIAQALLFFIAGFETVSSAMSTMAYELAVNPDIQKKLQEEIDEVSTNYVDEVPFDILLSMKYLDQVTCETLRKWPPTLQTDRSCNKNYTIKPTNPNEKTFVIEKGTMVTIPIVAIHHDPNYFPDPERFDPERFNDENKSKILTGSYIPFGVGPRNCIGSRFALLEIKTLFFYLLSKFDIVPNDKTEIPLRISPKKINYDPENGFQFTLKPRSFV